MSRYVPLIVLGLVLQLVVFGATPAALGQARDLDAWLQEAGLGPYAPEEEDWDAIYEKAKHEPPLQVYMSTSRASLMADIFRQQWPGVQVEEVFIAQADLIPRLEREWRAGVWNVGVVNLSRPESYAFLPAGSLVSYVPPEFRDQFPEEYQEPVFYTARTLRGWIYNPELSPEGPPFESLWDLTTERFRGKVILEDPLISSDLELQLITIVANADALAADYEARFGEPLKLREKDAGYEWLRRLLENDPQITRSWRENMEIVTNSKEIVVADAQTIRMANVVDGTYTAKVAQGITPVDSQAGYRWYAIGAFNQSPNAAKLFIRSMMTEEAGSIFFDQGFLSTQRDWEPTQPWMDFLQEMTFWDPDPEFVLQHGHDIIDFWLLHAP